ncbi:hypothetical protein C0585_01575 [Candidatus Woesearchaeota archaeon]|nr:MAG: hypothetical protein C0585_01575 [Candidatus Woesearchaeota archaeon]
MRNSLPILIVSLALIFILLFSGGKMNSTDSNLESPKDIMTFENSPYSSILLIIACISLLAYIEFLNIRKDELRLFSLDYDVLRNLIIFIISFSMFSLVTLLPPDLDFVMKIMSWAFLGALMIQVTFFIGRKNHEEYEKEIKRLIEYIEKSSDVNHSKHELLKKGWNKDMINEAIIRTLKLEHDAMKLINYEKKHHHKKNDVKHELLFAGWNEKLVDELIKRHW